MAGIRQTLEGAAIRYSVSNFFWSGANSIVERDRAAEIFATSLEDAIAALPHTHQVIVAHSHGGNVALRGLHLMCERGRVSPESIANLSLIAIATPFLQITKSKLSFVQWVIFLNMVLLTVLGIGAGLHAIAAAGGLNAGLSNIEFPILIAIALFVILLEISGQVLAGLARRPILLPASLANSTYYPPYDGAFRFLILRGVEDEASMALMFSSISKRLVDVAAAVGAYAVSAVAILLVTGIAFRAIAGNMADSLGLFSDISSLVWILLYLGAYVYLSTATAGFLRGVYGRELFGVPFGVSISVQSVPDLRGAAHVVTLPRIDQRDLELLHSLYEHPLCSAEAAAWMMQGTIASPTPPTRADIAR